MNDSDTISGACVPGCKSTTARPAFRFTDAIAWVLAHARRPVRYQYELSDLDDRTLQDLGMTRAQADFACGRGIWSLRR